MVIHTLKEDREYVQKFIDTRSYLLGRLFAGSGLYRVGDRSSRQVNQPFMLDSAWIESRLEVNPVRYCVSLQLEY